MTKVRAVLLLSAVLFAWNVWGYDLWAPDEPYFGEGAREMVVDGQWAVPHVNGMVTTDKPPLFFWLIAIVSLPFGEVTSLTARLPSMLAGLGILLLTVRLGRRLCGERVGGLAAMLLATNFMFWDKARTAQIDALLCFLILTALSAFETWRAGDAEGRRAGLLFWLAIALAVLAKGPVGLLLPLGIALVVLAFDRDLKAWRRFAPFTGPAAFVAILVGWMALATLGGGGEYSVWAAFREHVLDRAVHGLHHAQPWWYYAKVLPVRLLPWSALLPGAILLAWRRRDAGDRFLLVWSVFVVVFFSISTEKRDLYVLPAFPAFALLMARLVGEVCGWNWNEGGRESRTRVHPRWVTVPQGITGMVLILAGLALPRIAAVTEATPVAAAVVVAVALVIGGAVSTWAAIRDRRMRSVVAMAAATGLAYLLTASLLYPPLDRIKSARGFSERIKEITSESRARGNEVICFRLSNLPEAFSFYTDGVYFPETYDAGRLSAHLSGEDIVFAIVNEPDLELLADDLQLRLRVHERAELGRSTVTIVSNGASRPDGHPL